MVELPTGTVTFLFTDLESSTRLWEEQPDAMRDALARHDAILRESIEGHNGVVFSKMGDGIAAVFGSAPDALAGVLDAQRQFTAEAWDPTTGPLRARPTTSLGQVGSSRSERQLWSCCDFGRFMCGDVTSTYWSAVSPAIRARMSATSPGRSQFGKWSPGISMTSVAREANSARSSLLISLSLQDTNVEGTDLHAALVGSTTDAAARWGRSPDTNSRASTDE
jgi:hypothetical protein